jgi:RimJ/RimL family protein N-acetyltransferase
LAGEGVRGNDVGSLLTSDVRLRDVIEADLAVFFAQQLDPVANRMAAFTAKNPADRAAFSAKWAKILSDATGAKTILCEGHVAGNVLCFVAPWSGRREVSYWLGSEYWGRGVATKALTEFLGQFAERPLQARAAVDNLASIRVLEKCGFVLCGRDRGFANGRGEEIEEVIMELRADGSGGVV